MVPFEKRWWFRFPIALGSPVSIVTIAPFQTIRPQFAIECLRRSHQQEGHFEPNFK